jgi:hypothetical protein
MPGFNAVEFFLDQPDEMWLWPKGVYPGVETPITPDEPDGLDAGDGVEVLGVDGWRRVRRVRRVG